MTKVIISRAGPRAITKTGADGRVKVLRGENTREAARSAVNARDEADRSKDEADRAEDAAASISLAGLIPQAPDLAELVSANGTEWLVLEVAGVAKKFSLYSLAEYLGIDVPAPSPAWDVIPSISGTAQVGETLTGDDGEIRFGTVTARAWLRNGTVISGATGATYELVFADKTADISFRVTATGDGGTSISTSLEIGPVLGLASVLAGAFDTFDSGSGNIIGRTLEGKGGTWSLEKGTDASATHDTSMSVSGGFAGGNSVAGAGNHFAVVTASVQTVIVARRPTNPTFSNNLMCDHVTASGGTVANITRFAIGPTASAGPPLSGTLRFNAEVAGGSAAVIRTTNNLRAEAYDVLAEEYVEGVGSAVTVQFLRNGRKRDDPLDVSFATRSVPLSKKHGFSGNSPSNLLDWMAVIAPATDAVAMLEQTAMVASMNPDGTGTIYISGRYSVQKPGRLLAELRNRVSGSPVTVTGYSSVEVILTETEMDGLWGHFLGSIPVDATTLADVIDDPLELWVWRDDVLTGGGIDTTIRWPSPVFHFGTNVLYIGQSLSVEAANQTQSGTATPPTGSQWVNGYYETSIEDRPLLAATSNTVCAQMMEELGSHTGGAVALAACGKSGTPSDERVPGTDQHNAALDAITHMGGRVDVIVSNQGHSDSDDATDHYNDESAAFIGPGGYDEMNRGGPPLKVGVPLASCHDKADAVWQAVRDVQWRLFFEGVYDAFGPNMLDVRKYWNGSDLLHFGSSSTDPHGSIAIYNRRLGRVIAYLLGLVAHDGQGPELVAAVRASDTTIKGYFDDDGYFDDFELVGADFHGGCSFYTSGPRTGRLNPTGCTVGASRVSGGTYDGMWEVTWTFAGTLPAEILVYALDGANPHNPFQDATINQTSWANTTTGASILRGVKTGAPVGLDYVGIKGRYRYGENNYLLAA